MKIPSQMTDRMILEDMEALRDATRKQLNLDIAAAGGREYATQEQVDRWVGEFYPDYAVLLREAMQREIWPPTE